jgi:hypothetical protein
MKAVVGPLNSLLYSRKALIATVDAVFSIVAVVVTTHLSPELTEEVLAICAILQPLIITWINAIAKEDAAEKAAK